MPIYFTEAFREKMIELITYHYGPGVIFKEVARTIIMNTEGTQAGKTTSSEEKAEGGSHRLPSWRGCATEVINGDATPLQSFIYSHEPDSSQEEVSEGYRTIWRTDLAAVLDAERVAARSEMADQCAEEKQDYEGRIRYLQNVLKESRANNRELNEKIQSDGGQIKYLQAALDESRADNQTLYQKDQEFCSTIKGLREELRREKLRNVSPPEFTMGTMQSKDRITATTACQIQILTNQNYMLQNELKSVYRLLNSSEKKRAKLVETLQDKAIEKETLTERLDAEIRALNALKARYDKEVVASDVARTEAQSLRARVGDLQAELSKTESARVLLREDLEYMQARHDQAVLSANTQEQYYKVAKGKIEALQDELEYAKKDGVEIVETMNIWRETFFNAQKELNDQLSKLKTKKDALEKQVLESNFALSNCVKEKCRIQDDLVKIKNACKPLVDWWQTMKCRRCSVYKVNEIVLEAYSSTVMSRVLAGELERACNLIKGERM